MPNSVQPGQMSSLQVKDYLAKQGRQACKTLIESAANKAFLKTSAEESQATELNKDTVMHLLDAGERHVSHNGLAVAYYASTCHITSVSTRSQSSLEQ